MDFPGPILAVGKILPAGTPQTGASPKCLIIEVRTPTSRGEFIHLEVAESAASDLAARTSAQNRLKRN
jgi:hypothetical protein